ncbi:MAG: hypothetical protein JSW08_00445 [archaeon]|nr:MAG: hypothetical protein JSW08_00445 [archaeon]
MVTYKLNEEIVYIDGILGKKLERDVITELRKKDMDVVFAIAGKERSGKSTFGQVLGGFIAAKLGTKFDETNICMTPDELRIRIEHAQKNEVIIYDEAHRGMGSTRALSEVNNVLRDLFMEMGQLNLCVIVILPSFFMLDKYIALHRTRGLFYVYMNSGQRGFWTYFNEKDKKKLYLKGKKTLDVNCVRFPNFRGRFYKKTPINEEVYRKKKRESFKRRERLTRSERYMEQRDVLIIYMGKMMGLTQQRISDILKTAGASITRQEISLIQLKNRDVFEKFASARRKI